MAHWELSRQKQTNKQFFPVLRGRAIFGNILKGRDVSCEAESTLFFCYDNYVTTSYQIL